jgi:hypothetical protein
MAEAKYTVKLRALIQTEITPANTSTTDDRALFVDFGRAAFGTLIVPVQEDSGRDSIIVHLGEKLTNDGRIDRTPPGNVCYICIEQKLDTCLDSYRITIPG